MMRDPLPDDIDRTQEAQATAQKKAETPNESSIHASNAIKYTAYIMLLFGFLYFLIQYLGPMLQ